MLEYSAHDTLPFRAAESPARSVPGRGGSMTGTVWLDLAALALGALWIAAALLFSRGVGGLRRLEGAAEAESGAVAEWPRVSIIVASRDEAEHVPAALGSLLALDYPDHEVIAVNDRSTDGTGEAIDALARQDPRLRAVDVRELPAGWLGKCNALRRGVEAASGEWLLFTDADVKFHPGTLRRAVRYAMARDVDFLTLIPANETRSISLRALMAFEIILVVLLLGLWARTRRRQSLASCGIGAFMLVRRVAYEKAGGHEAIRLSVLDDLVLGARVRRAGGRTEIALARDSLRVPYSATVKDLFHVTRKNMFTLFRYSVPLLVAGIAMSILVDVVTPFLFVIDPRLWPASLAAWASLAFMYWRASRLAGAPWSTFLLHPATSLLGTATSWSSAIAVLREGGVRWRGSFYPLEELRAYSRRRSAGHERLLK